VGLLIKRENVKGRAFFDTLFVVLCLFEMRWWWGENNKTPLAWRCCNGGD
jgi:hypothetical protein